MEQNLFCFVFLCCLSRFVKSCRTDVVGLTSLGKHFGNLAHIRGMIYYQLSPHEQKPFATAIAKGILNFIPRTSATILTWLPALITGILVYKGVEEGYRKRLRKNPDDYINEVNPLA